MLLSFLLFLRVFRCMLRLAGCILNLTPNVLGVFFFFPVIGSYFYGLEKDVSIFKMLYELPAGLLVAQDGCKVTFGGFWRNPSWLCAWPSVRGEGRAAQKAELP